MNDNFFYADANAGLPVSARHLEQLNRRLLASDGNPSSIHSFGRRARVAVEQARRDICRYLAIDTDQLLFTSGGTESNNLIIRNIVDKINVPRIAISAGDHPSITTTAEQLQAKRQCTVDVIAIDHQGLVIEQQLAQIVQEQTALICLTYANSETGVINDVNAIAERIRQLNRRVHIHCDAVQMLGKMPIVIGDQIDSAAFSAHKLGALKGCGALFVRRPNELHCQLSGGSQEQNLRAGTENLIGIMSFALIVNALPERLARWQRQVETLKNRLLANEWLTVHGHRRHCLPNTVNFHIDGVRGDDIVVNLDLAGIAISSGSACSSGINRPSRVLTAMGYSEEIANNSVRVSFNEGNEQDVDRLCKVLKHCRDTV